MPQVHPTALVDRTARLDGEVTIGPYCIVGEGVRLGRGVVLQSHVVVGGRTSIGAESTVFSFAVLGGDPQSKSFRGEAGELTIGERVVIREHVTVNIGTTKGGLVTRVGDGCLIMAGCHVGHDCVVEADVVLANQVLLGGHVHVGTGTVVGGMTAVHQHVRIGRFAMIGGMSGVDADVIPFGLAYGNRATLRGLNLKGLRRRGFSRSELLELGRVYRVMFDQRDRSIAAKLASVRAELEPGASSLELIDFVAAAARRPLCLPA